MIVTAINMVKDFIIEVFIKDEGVIRRSTLTETEELGFTAFKEKRKINF